jgi:hypothetical protein
VWVAEPVKWPEQRARFQEVIGEAFGVEPAPIAKPLTHVIKLRDDLAKRITMQRIAAARKTNVGDLALAREIQATLDGVGRVEGDGGARGEGLTCREAGPLLGASRTTIGRHVSLARLVRAQGVCVALRSPGWHPSAAPGRRRAHGVPLGLTCRRD